MFKENLMSALKRAVDLHNSGSSDDQAVIKAAAEHQFNPDQTQRLVETYNTAKTICFYKTAEDRTTRFSLASGPDVIKALFKDRTSAAKTASLYDYSCYDKEPSFSKAAEDIDFMSGIKHVDDSSSDNVLSAKLKAVDSLKMAADRAWDAACMLDMAYGESINKLAAIVGPDKAAHAIAAFEALPLSDMALPVLDDVRARFGISKNAELPSFTDFDISHPEAVAEFTNACDCYVKYASYVALHSALSDDAEKAERELTGLTGRATFDDVFTPKISAMLERGDVKVAEKAPSFDPLAAVGSGVTSGISWAAKDRTKQTAKTIASRDENASKVFTERAKNLHRKFLLEKLITTDPILKGVPEEDVIRAYQTIVEIAPDVSLNEDITRSILRQAASSAALTPYDAKTIVDLDAAIRKQLEQTSGSGKEKKVKLEYED